MLPDERVENKRMVSNGTVAAAVFYERFLS